LNKKTTENHHANQFSFVQFRILILYWKQTGFTIFGETSPKQFFLDKPIFESLVWHASGGKLRQPTKQAVNACLFLVKHHTHNALLEAEIFASA
jgi:hypothetical protein